MGRLFWKFFAVFMLAQVVTVAGVSTAIWLRHRDVPERQEFAPGPRPALPPDAAPGRGAGPDRPPGPPPPGKGAGPMRSVFPIEPLAGGLLASLAFAALLAWYVAKPIRSLRQAFDAAAEGQLDARVGDSMGRRRDELADLGRAFDRTAGRLKALVDGQRRLLHDVSHELRSPLARLQAAVGLARQQPEDLEASMDRIEREAARMDKLVDELLTLSRVETGMSAARDDGIELSELVNEVVEDAMFEQRSATPPVILETDVVLPAGVGIKGNAEMLHRAVENVVRNAVRHTLPGGRVRIAGRHDAGRSEFELTIADEGPGVPEAEQEAIFEPFFRGASAGGTRGHGLGLAIARRVIEAHGGRISVANRPAGGLVVTLRLPS
jgi:two-component system OmpR family sensor kinase